MKKKPHIFRHMESSLLIPIAMCFFPGCRHKDIIEDIGQSGFPLVVVEYDWENHEIFRPDGMANLFYSTHESSQSYWRSDFRPSGGSLRLPADQYNVIAFNNDTENIVFSDIDNFDKFTLSTSEIDTSSIPDDQLPFPSQKLYHQPDRIWAALLNNIDIKDSSNFQTIKISPRRITREYHIEMTGIENLESALRYYALISDLSPAFKMSSLTQTGKAATVGNFMQPIDDTAISTTITNFGPNKDSHQQRLAIYMWLADGARKVYMYDVTDQIREAPDSMNLVIRVKGPSLPQITPGEGGAAGGGGLDVGVDNWDFIDIEL